MITSLGGIRAISLSAPAVVHVMLRVLPLLLVRQPHHDGHAPHIFHIRSRWPGRPHVLWQLHLPLLLFGGEVDPFVHVSVALPDPFPSLQLLTIFPFFGGMWNANLIMRSW